VADQLPQRSCRKESHRRPGSRVAIPSPTLGHYQEITHLIIPEGVVRINDYAFCFCNGLVSVDMPSSVTKIGRDAFSSCVSLSSVRLSENITHIGESAFNGCTCLPAITLPNGLVSVEDHLFQSCTNLTNVNIPVGVTSIGYMSFYRCRCFTSLRIPENVKTIGRESFYECENLTKIVIPNSVTNIGYSAFGKCYQITDVSMPGRFCIGNVFADSCANIETVAVADGTEIIVDYFCEGCYDLSSVTLPLSLKGIGKSAFSYRGLSEIEIPQNVTNISEWAFFSSGLTNIAFCGNAPTCADSAVKCLDGECVISVYRGTSGWDPDGDGLWKGLKLVYSDWLPCIDSNATADEIKFALSSMRDCGLARNISTADEYERFRIWADKVKQPRSIVASSQNAWLSFALGCEKLIDRILTNGLMKVEKFEPTSTSGSFEFTIGIDDVVVGSEASKENLKKVFGIEGGTTLDTLSSANVDVIFGTPENGKVKLTASPNSDNADAKSFFMKVKMTP